MPICKKCNNTFPNRLEIDGKLKNLGNRKYCICCSPYKMHNTRQLDIDIVEENSSHKKCIECGEKIVLGEFYETIKGHKKYRRICKKCTSEKENEHYKILKLRAIEYKGGKCCSCGYNKYFGALDFHHRNPKEKDFLLSRHRSFSFEKIKSELDKCDLLCKNCHSELHAI